MMSAPTSAVKAVPPSASVNSASTITALRVRLSLKAPDACARQSGPNRRVVSRPRADLAMVIPLTRWDYNARDGNPLDFGLPESFRALPKNLLTRPLMRLGGQSEREARYSLLTSSETGEDVPRSRQIGLALALLAAASSASAQPAQPFHLQEATIASVHAAFASGQLTCAQLTKLYLDRIAAYNLKGPTLRAVITVNPRAMDIAAEMDRQYRANRASVGPLHCVPIMLKDNFNTFDMPTSGGNVGMKTSQPSADAFVVDHMRKAGALILAKANLQEFARGGISISSLGGQVRNPYDLTRTPGGSSGGTGAAVAANLALIGTGGDTGQSIRSPSSANNLVGIRPTRGLVSRRGVVPSSETQDEVGPIARTVTDAALLLDVMAGYDAADPITAFGTGRIPKSYTHLLTKDALKGARIGVMTNLLGDADRHREVNSAMDG